jgi:hypothetical protein
MTARGTVAAVIDQQQAEPQTVAATPIGRGRAAYVAGRTDLAREMIRLPARSPQPPQPGSGWAPDVAPALENDETPASTSAGAAASIRPSLCAAAGASDDLSST